ncbi:Endophilin-B2 [Portunus trituberculatus]|uniref:Endophilin-B2 n=1 Tax=Portunus trituberculatus TaxID=210409 RepID=A0A5B7HUI5_PORTR|nr:Endophilin-B2 [Portunus trituberculatus]
MACFQYTEEKIGSAEKTELDRHFESLSLQADAARQWTEKLVIGAEAVLIPNPGEPGVIQHIHGNQEVSCQCLNKFAMCSFK